MLKWRKSGAEVPMVEDSNPDTFDLVNRSRYRPGDPAGFYESFFVRANHPTRPLAFWIRYTVTSPAGKPEQAVGELWAAVFDGERGEHIAVVTPHPARQCSFGSLGMRVSVAGALMESDRLRGEAASDSHGVSWDLRYRGDERPLRLFSPALYEGRFPKAKALVGLPHARFDGEIRVDGAPLLIDGWVGSHNHNWGEKHTDRYAWVQVAGFAGEPGTFLELGTGQIRVGPLWSPTLTPIVLRRGGRDHALNTLVRSVKNRGHVTTHRSPFLCEFSGQDADVHIEGVAEAPESAFVLLTYRDPPGGTKRCRNSKIASCRLTVTDRRTGVTAELESRHGAAFEILD